MCVLLAVGCWPLAEAEMSSIGQLPTANGRPFSSTDRPLLDSLLPLRHHHSMHEDPRRVHAIRLELARLDQLLHFGDANLPRRGGHRIEVARGLAVLQVAEAVAFLRGDQREVADDAA